MPAAYDTYDYLSYWLGRGYEHKSEVVCLKDLLAKIKKINTILEVGAGFGRHISSYSFRAKKLIITDSSGKLLKIARETYGKKKNIKFIHSSLENLPQKVRTGSIDLVVMIRVIHHMHNLDDAFTTLKRLLMKRGYLILEYPNKRNWKAVLKELILGNFIFPLDIFPKDLRSPRSIKKNVLPFFNYHPDRIEETLNKHGFEIIEKRSVSNLRSSPLKKLLSVDTLLALEKTFQKPLATLSFGPSIFLLAQKRD